MPKKFYEVKTLLLAEDVLLIKAESADKAVDIARNIPICCYFRDDDEYSKNGFDSEMYYDNVEILDIKEIEKNTVSPFDTFLEEQHNTDSDEE